MGNSYTRNDTSNNIADGNIINASDLDGEFDAIESAMGTSGHTHDGTAGEGGPITKLGPVQDLVVSASAVTPKTDNTLDLGSASLEFKNGFFDGTVNIDSLVADTADINGGNIDGTIIGAASAAEITGTTLNATGDTSAGDNAAIGYTSAEGLILTGQGSTSDITLKNDADATVFSVPTGTDDILFPDSAKAMFGAGSDLQIYHDGSNSYIREVGDGGLIVQASTSVSLQGTNTSSLATFSEGGAATLYHNNAAKLATTSTGVDVTGTVTADGLSLTSDDPTITMTDSSGTNDIATLQATSGALIVTARDGSADGEIIFKKTDGSATDETMRLDSSGNVGISNNAPDFNLSVGNSSSVNPSIQIMSATNSNAQLLFGDGAGAAGYRGTVVYGNATDSMSFSTAGAERMRITSGGSVGIGTSSPASNLHIYNTSYPGLRFDDGTAYSTIYNDSTDGSLVYSADDGNARAGSKQLFYVDGAERMRIDASGNVGIGTASPLRALHVESSSNLVGRFKSTGSTEGFIQLAGSGTGTAPRVGATGNSFVVYTGDAERMRLDALGNLIVGKTSPTLSTAGSYLQYDGFIGATRDGNAAIGLNRLTSDGDIALFQKSGTTVGSIGTYGGYANIGTSNVGLMFNTGSTAVIPHNMSTNAPADNTIDLGQSGYRFQDIFATNGTIQTSDQNEKQDIEELTDAEQRVAVAAKGLLRKYRWKDSVAEKGDDARIHFGIIAQDLKAAFEAEGLDAGRYAMFINSEWTDEETGEQKNRMGIRYNQLLAFIIAAI